MSTTLSSSKETLHPDARGFRLLTPVRQRLFFSGLAQRSGRGQFDQQAMERQHRDEQQRLEEDVATQLSATTEECRLLRRKILRDWDQGDERRIAHYEASTLKTRDQKNRRLSILRKQRKQQVQQEEQRHDAAVSKVEQHFKEQKPKIAQRQRAEHERLTSKLAQASQETEATRQLTLKRLGNPKELAEIVAQAAQQSQDHTGNSGASQRDADSTVAQSLDHMEHLLAEIKSLHQQMHQGTTVKFIESYYLVFPVIAIIAAWCGAVYAFAAQPLLIWMLGAIPAAMIGGFVLHTLCARPVRKNTRLLQPRIEINLNRCIAICSEGQVLASNYATKCLEELTAQRVRCLEELREKHEHEMLEMKNRFRELEEEVIESHNRQLEEIESSFVSSFTGFAIEMKTTADVEAQRIANTLDTERQSAELRRQQLQSAQAASITFLQNRLQTGVARALARASETAQFISQQFPDWSQVIAQPRDSSSDFLRWLPLGHFQLQNHLPDLDNHLLDAVPPTIPIVLVRETHAAVVIDCPGEQMHVAAEWVRAVLWRAMTAVKPGRMKLTLLDTVGRGENFASLVALGDFDPTLISHRAWSATAQVTARLSELTQHLEDILQTCLRDRYASIEDFNREALQMAEPYRLVAAFGVPTGISRDAVDSLRALIEGGRRCGVFTIIVRDTSQQWPVDLPELPNAHVLRLRIDAQGQIRHVDPTLGVFPIIPVIAPPASDLPALAEVIGRTSLVANRVEIPLDDLVPAIDYDSQDSAHGLAIPVGRQGVGRSLEIQLGSGMRQHLLVAGKTGSGKSTLLHALIMSAAMRYPPDQLHLYLLDFKKGVEFKVYADSQLPHARVIGIESEREFGRSVLQRLDEELQQRGELFRGAGVQEMAEYRRRTQCELPRILLVVDEFQELFTRDDRIAQECTMLLDRLVRQGRSFGIHVVLSSQSLAGAYTLPRATLGQMAVRIALQCSEADAAMILADDNTAARLLSRPGEAIFNDASGLVEGNQPFQVAWIGIEKQRQRLADIASRHSDFVSRLGPALVFEGNRPAIWTPALAEAAISQSKSSDVALGLLGEAVRIGPPTTLRLADAGGRNVLCVADQKSIAAVMANWVSTAAKQVRSRTGCFPRVIVFEGRRGDDQPFSLGQWLDQIGVANHVVRPRDSQQEIERIALEVSGGAASNPDAEPATVVPTFVIIDELERFRDLRQDDTFSFSLDGSAASGGGVSLQKLLSDGPAAGFHTLLGCAGAEAFSRWLPRTSQHDLELRIVGRISANDSAQLIDTPDAANLSPASMLLYDDADGSLEKFRLCEIPDVNVVKNWLTR